MVKLKAMATAKATFKGQCEDLQVARATVVRRNGESPDGADRFCLAQGNCHVHGAVSDQL